MSTTFEEAVRTIITGNATALKGLLQEAPGLIAARSASGHRATLLHYVAANGVEDELQKTPANAVEIARILIEAGAEVDALADTYGGGTNQTTLCLLVSSCHPAEAGLQPALAQVLCDAGAAVNGVADDGAPLATALMFSYTRSVDVLVQCGARMAPASATCCSPPALVTWNGYGPSSTAMADSGPVRHTTGLTSQSRVMRKPCSGRRSEWPAITCGSR